MNMTIWLGHCLKPSINKILQNILFNNLLYRKKKNSWTICSLSHLNKGLKNCVPIGIQTN